MRTLPWDRDQRIREVRDRIWVHLSPTLAPSRAGLLAAQQLLGWGEQDALALARVQLMLTPEAAAFVDALPRLLRRLTNTATPREMISRERIDGPVRWAPTLALQAATADRSVHVTAPARRDYQTVENELLVHVLDGLVAAGQRIGWPPGSGRHLANRIAALTETAARWQQHRVLHEIVRVPPTARSLARIRSGRAALRYQPALDLHARYRDMVEDVDRAALQDAVETAGLVTADEPTLFELLCLFGLLAALPGSGWTPGPPRMLRGHTQIIARHADGRRLRLWYQSTPPEMRAQSRYRHVLSAHAFPRQVDLRPDFVIEWTDPAGRGRRLLVECKLSQAGGIKTAARRAVQDLLMYRRSYGPQGPDDEPYGLGIVWGDGLHGAASSEILLATPDTLSTTLRHALC